MKTDILLNNGRKMPLLGLGCWAAPKDEVAGAVETAINCGYRHIDTAYSYLNEDGVGAGIAAGLKSGKVKRSDLFVVSKLPMTGMRPNDVEKFLTLSLKDLNLSYVDMYLVHSPFGAFGKDDKDVFPVDDEGNFNVDLSTDLIAVWKTMEKMVDKGLTKSIGVSNFSERQITKIVANARIPPANLQVECHVYFQQKALREFCKKHNIAVTAYAPIGSPGRKAFYEQRGVTVELPDLLNNPVVKLISAKHKKTSAQVLLRFLAQQDVIVIPKSCNPERIKQNGQIFDFELDSTDMAALESIDQNQRTFDTKIFKGLEKHPENYL